MLKPTRLLRILTIFKALLKHTANRSVISPDFKTLRALSYLNPYSYSHSPSRGEALRLMLENLGPIYVKFGQLLSIRGDLLPRDIILELQKLQDNVAPFPSEEAVDILEAHFERSQSQNLRPRPT